MNRDSGERKPGSIIQGKDRGRDQERGNLDHSVRVQTEGGIRREETWITQSGYRQREGSGERKPGSLIQGTDRGRDQERGNLDHSVRVQTEGGMLERGNLDHSVRVQTEGGIRREETWITQSGYRQREGSGERKPGSLSQGTDRGRDAGERKPGSLSQGTDRGRDQERGNLDHSVRVQTEGGMLERGNLDHSVRVQTEGGIRREETWITQSGYRQREGSGERKPGSLSQDTDRGRDQERGNLDHSVRVQTEGGIRREETWITQSGYRQREGSGERKPGSLSHGTDRGRDQERGNLDQSLKDREIEGRVVREKDTGERYTGERDTGDRKIGGRDTGDRKIEGRDTGKRDM